MAITRRRGTSGANGGPDRRCAIGNGAGQFYAQPASRHATPFWQTRAARPELPETADLVPALSPAQVLRLSPDARIASRPCLTARGVERLDCVDHARLPEPVAFVTGLTGLLVWSLLRRAEVPTTAGMLVAQWTQMAGPARAVAILDWAWRHGLLAAV